LLGAVLQRVQELVVIMVARCGGVRSNSEDELKKKKMMTFMSRGERYESVGPRKWSTNGRGGNTEFDDCELRRMRFRRVVDFLKVQY
jgi:hypothetical protein